jgi:TldD protein
MSGGTGSLVEPDLAGRALERALARGGDFAELFCEERSALSISLDESRVERPRRGFERGAGLRVVSGEVTYFAHVDGLAEEDLLRAAEAASAALSGERSEPVPISSISAASGQEIEHRPEEIDDERKAQLLRVLDERARARGAEIASVQGSYGEERRRVEIANSEGLHAGDDRTRVRLAAQTVARRDGRAETGAETLGGHRGFELVADRSEEVGERAAERALTMLDAGPAPSGSMRVVVGGGFGGVLFHEMTGHGLEADHVQKGASVYKDRIGERLAEPLVTAYDDGRLPNEWGTEGIDDEGTPTQRTAVIEEGKLSSYLYDLLRARKDGAEPTGNGRRESFRHLPIPRMTNTYIAPGDANPAEVISEVKRGFYAVSFAGGQVEPATGDFVFGVSEGYLIEDGRQTRPCRGATLIGNGLDALRAIDAVGSDFEMKTGYCGKGGQSVPVGTGQGHVRIRELTVGGTGV